MTSEVPSQLPYALASRFVAELGEARDAVSLGTTLAQLEGLLVERAMEGEAAWPEARVAREAFVDRMARSVTAEPAPLAALRSLHAADLYLACACAGRSHAALEAFERRHLAILAQHVAPIDGSPAFADEVRQKVREALFVPDEGRRGKIEEYTGRGALGAWLRVIAVRTALNLRRRQRPEGGLGELDDFAAAMPDPELDYLKARCKKEFREAFVAALERLTPEHRNVLRLHHLDGLTLEETASACRIGRSTAARWLAEARASLLKDTHALLASRLGLSGGEVESVLRLLDSELDVSMHRHLGSVAEGSREARLTTPR